MMSFCPATGRLAHKFDKTTHRCACGRWERGFKPKEEPKTPRCECQLCERTQAIDKDGKMVHHGYRRPGWGFITGDCFGVGYKPYPATDALEEYLLGLRNYLASLQSRLAKLPTLTEIEHTYTIYTDFPHRRKPEQKKATLRPGDGYQYLPQGGSLPSFEDALRTETYKVEGELKHARSEEARIVKRIADAQK